MGNTPGPRGARPETSRNDGRVKTIDLSRELTVARGAIAPLAFGWLAMAVIATVFYTLTASAPTLGETTWHDVARMGTGWWMTTLGGQTEIQGVAISLMPTLMTLIMVYASVAVFRRRLVARWGEVAAAAIAQAAVVALIGVAVRPEGVWWPAIIGGAIMGGVTAAWAGRDELLVWPWLARALPRTGVFLGVLAVLTTATVAVAFVGGWSRMTQIHGYYLTGAVGTAGLLLVQLAYLPTAFIWALAWLLGPGFSVGQGTHFSVLGVESAPLPAIPLLGALPSVGDGYPWMLGVLAAIFLIVGAVVTRREKKSLPASLLDSALAALIGAFVVAALAAMGTGAIGPERLAQTGPVPPVMFGMALLVLGLPYLLGALVHPQTLTFLRARSEATAEWASDRRQDVKDRAEERAAERAEDDERAGQDELSGDDGVAANTEERNEPANPPAVEGSEAEPAQTEAEPNATEGEDAPTSSDVAVSEGETESALGVDGSERD